jgi:cytochrome c biogenesis protein CcdA
MTLLVLSFVAGVLTVLAPCVLPILPVIVGGSVVNGKKSRPWVIIISFAVSILIFTLILQRLVQQFGLRPSTLTKVAA